MPTVDCDLTDCEKHGAKICIAKEVKWRNGRCSEYKPRVDKRMMEPAFKSNCYKERGKFKTSRVTKVFR